MAAVEKGWGKVRTKPAGLRRCEASPQLLEAKLAFQPCSPTFLAAGNFRHSPRAGLTCIQVVPGQAGGGSFAYRVRPSLLCIAATSHLSLCHPISSHLMLCLLSFFHLISSPAIPPYVFSPVLSSSQLLEAVLISSYVIPAFIICSQLI